MKIDLNAIDQNQFMMHPHIVNGEVLYLVQPQHIGATWTQENKHFRSSVWNDAGELVSAGFPKFTNWGEKPEQFPVPQSLKDCNVVEKLDGSLLIVSKYKGNYILQGTRGTVDATKLDNGHELEIFKEKYQTAFNSLLNSEADTWEFSLLFEWVSPIQRIILSYGDEPQWYLVGGINHKDYSLWSQGWLNDVAKRCLASPRPPIYSFPSVEDLMRNVEQWKGKEGVVIYSKHDQVLHKVKCFEYLKKHRFKSEATLENTLELYFVCGQPTYQEFEAQLKTSFDYECFEMVRGFVSQISDAAKEVRQMMSGFTSFIKTTLMPLTTRREQAEKVLAAYSTTNRASMVFTLLDGKSLSEDQLKKLFWQVLKK